MSDLMPVIFFGHGNPMNALSKNRYTEGWASVGKSIPRPQAVLCVSAHYYIPFTMVTAGSAPPTIHDFSGFPPELYRVEYPATGDPELASRVRELLGPGSVRLDESWGLDHGTWAVLKHVFPDADIPVVQLSIDETKPPVYHYETGKRLLPLRKERVLIIGSGNIVHNLRAYAWDRPETAPFEWAVRFEDHVKEMLDKGDVAPLVDYASFGRDAALSVPTPDHYLPFLYTLGLRRETDKVSFPVKGVDGGSVSMLCVRIDPGGGS